MDHLAETLEGHRNLATESQNIAKELTIIKQENQGYKSEVSYLRKEN